MFSRYLILIAGLVLAINLMVFDFSLWYLVFFIFLILRIIAVQNKTFWASSAAIAAGFAVFFLAINQPAPKIDFAKPVVLNVLEDTRKNNTFIANSKYGKLLCYYEGETDNYLEAEIAPKNVRKPKNLNAFDYPKYLRGKGINNVVKITKINKQKNKFEINIRAWMMRRGDTLFKSLFLGWKDEDYNENYSKLGIIFLFSLSGLQFAVIFDWINYGLKRMGITLEKIRYITIPISLFLYVISGCSVVALRVLLTKNINNFTRYKIPRITLFAIVLMISLIIKPKMFLTSSAVFTYYIGFAAIFISQYIYRQSLIGTRANRKGDAVKESLYKQRKTLTNFSILLTLSLFPLFSYYFYQYNLLAILLIALLTPFVKKILMPLILIDFIIPIKLIDIFILNLNRIIDKIAEIKMFTVTTGKPLYIFVLFAVIIYFFALESKLRYIAITIALCFTTAFSPLNTFAFIDVGQGDASVFIPAFTRQAILVDTGGLLDFKTNESISKGRDVIDYLKSEGVSTIDTIFLTHDDFDHIGDLEFIKKEFKVKQIVYPLGCTKIKGKPVLAPLAYKGFKIIYPFEPKTGENDNSLGIITKKAGQTILLMGDLGAEQEKEINYEADVLKLGHHGSNSATSPEFLDKAKPKLAIISCGENNRYHHPSAEVTRRLAQRKIKVLRTDENGMIFMKWFLNFRSNFRANVVK